MTPETHREPKRSTEFLSRHKAQDPNVLNASHFGSQLIRALARRLDELYIDLLGIIILDFLAFIFLFGLVGPFWAICILIVVPLLYCLAFIVDVARTL